MYSRGRFKKLLLIPLVCLQLVSTRANAFDDELNHPCPLPHKFHCQSGECINKLQQCDGREDCRDASDEHNCYGKCESPHWWRCNDGECISATFRCNREVDCKDKSDEQHCNNDYKQDILPSQTCPLDTVECADGSQCVLETSICDGELDCNDGSDEQQCQSRTFPCEGFVCGDGNCLLDSWKCDGTPDCSDGSDEEHCVPSIEHCTIDKGYYLCKDNKTCLPFTLVCDHKDDCPDKSDEGKDCFDKPCLTANCSYGCWMTPDGPKCYCDHGFNSVNSTECEDIDECKEKPSLCSHVCVNTVGSYHCACSRGFVLMKDNHTCRPIEEEPLLVFNTKNDVRIILLESDRYYSVSDRVNRAQGVAFDGKHVYWTQLSKGKEGIMRAPLDGNTKEVVINNGISSPIDISIDWLTGNVYFTDSDYQHLAVCSNDGLHCTILLSKNIRKPRAIAVHSTLGIMFWTDWEEPAYVGRANMDGSEENRLITKNVVSPNGLCIDFQDSKIYWVDGHFSQIESANFDGTDRKVVLEGIKNPYWLDVYGDTIYWSSSYENKIKSCHKKTGKNKKTIVSSKKFFGVKTYYPGKWNRTANVCLTSKCQFLCLLKGTNSYTCACPEGKKLARDGFSCIETTPTPLMLMAGGSLFITIDHQALGKQSLVVKHQFTEASVVVYDGIKDRAIVYDDGKKAILSVERYKEDKPIVKIITDYNIGQIEDMDFDYRTNNLYWCDLPHGTIEVMNLETRHRAVVYKSHIGDAAIDIALVPNNGYMFVAFRSYDGFIHISKMGMDGRGLVVVIQHGYVGPMIRLHYDHHSEKLYISDRNKIDVMHSNGFDRELFRKLNGDPMSITTQNKDVFWTDVQSTKLYWTDKLDMSDEPIVRKISMELPDTPFGLHLASTAVETVVQHHTCLVSANFPYESSKYPCSHVCVQRDNTEIMFFNQQNVQSLPTHRCLCPLNMVLKSDLSTCEKISDCVDNQFLCHESNLCIDQQKRCNGEMDCFYHEDEIGCSVPGNSSCTHDQFACKDGSCVDRTMICDKKRDCSDGSDEEDCQKYGLHLHCTSQQFRCSSGICLDKHLECDGEFDCPDGEDESRCEGKKCKKDQFKCISGQCIPKGWECDGAVDCTDNSDEHNKCAYLKKCDPSAFKCANGFCIDMSQKCDGFSDCKDNSDEMFCVNQTQISQRKECDDDEYACYTNTSICIPQESRCDHHIDCPKGEDEMGCSPCTNEEWECTWRENTGKLHSENWHGQCIYKDWLCDESHDCVDGSDEDKTMCAEVKKNKTGSRISVLHHKNVHLVGLDLNCDGGFRCNSGECMDYALVCNHEDNCYDGSDEGGHCDTACTSSYTCQQVCHKTPRGGVCACDHGYQLFEDGKSCHPAPPPCLKSPCDQLCQNGPNSTFTCLCFSGYQLKNDRRSCKAVGAPMSIIYVANNNIYRYNPNNGSAALVYEHKQSGERISGLDVQTAKKSLFYSVKDSGAIHHVDLVFKKETHISDLGSPTVIAFDWVSENIYYVDAGNITKIRVCHTSRESCVTLFTTNNLVPALAVDPINKYMIYCTSLQLDGVASSNLFKANLDGSNVQHIPVDMKIRCDRLAVDYDRQIVYITDSKWQTITSINYKNMSAVHLPINLSSFTPRNIQFFEDSIYVDTANSTKLLVCGTSAHNKECHYKNILSLFQSDFMRIDQINKQRKMPNLCANISCSHLCVVVGKEARCICSHGAMVESGKPCKISGDKQGTFTTIANNNTPNAASGRSIAAVLIIFSICFLLLGSFVYVKKQKQKTSLADKFKVQFERPSLSTIIAPLVNIKAAAANKFASNRNKPNPKETLEYENPLNKSTWPKDIMDNKVEMLHLKDPKLLQVPNLLVDSDSDVESDRDLHDGEFRDKMLLIP